MKVSPDVAALNPHLFATVTQPAVKAKRQAVAKWLEDGPVPMSRCHPLGNKNLLLCPSCDAPIVGCVTAIHIARFHFECGHEFTREVKR